LNKINPVTLIGTRVLVAAPPPQPQRPPELLAECAFTVLETIFLLFSLSYFFSLPLSVVVAATVGGGALRSYEKKNLEK
jgi:hypothetical protein